MSGADYAHCDHCNTKAFYDAETEIGDAAVFHGKCLPEHDAAVAAKALPVEGCACTSHVQDAGGGYFEHLLEYEPACPEHSEHLWDPRQGMWVDRAAHDAVVASSRGLPACDTRSHAPTATARLASTRAAAGPTKT